MTPPADVACPACGAREAAVIVWGMVTPEVLDDPDVVIGGCVVDADSPNRRCLACGHGWR
jgi:hypothetical protein